MAEKDTGASASQTGLSQVEPQEGLAGFATSIPSAWHHAHLEKPAPCQRVVMLYNDGSGARLGFWTGEELIDAEGDERPWDGEPGEMWAYLPPFFPLWCEQRCDDPFTFPAQGIPTEGGDCLQAPFMGSPVLEEDAP